MMTPTECLELELERICVESNFTKDTGMKSSYRELKEEYRDAIDLIEANQNEIN